MATTVATNRDREILDTLTLRIRVMAMTQISRTWWPELEKPTNVAERRLRTLERRGLVELVTLSARPEIAMSAPLATWREGRVTPNFAAVAHRLRTRWKQAGPARRTACVIASGWVMRQPRISETTHDLHLAAVYLLMLRDHPTRAKTWTFESQNFQPNEKLPDALVSDGRLKTAIELGGEYTKHRLEAFHAHCHEQGYGYEIW